jgi:rare lipoprotein A (peptidoglycan hydrolase)
MVVTFWAVDARAQTFTTLDVPGAASTGASGIKNNGQISGQCYDSNGVSHGFLYNGGSFTTINYPGAAIAIAEGINNNGQIAAKPHVLRSMSLNRVFLSVLSQSIGGVARGSFVCGNGATLATIAGCAQPPAQQGVASNSKEYFSSAIYGPASPRVVAEGEPVPHGGGQYLVGRPYAGRAYYSSEKTTGYSAVGMASWYGDAFHGRLTANGEVYDKLSLSAAHPTMPLPSYARVTNLRNRYSIMVRVNDRGPRHSGRVMDVSQRVAEVLDFKHLGTTKVRVDYVGKAGLEGTDEMLLATLRTDGNVALDERVSSPQSVSICRANYKTNSPGFLRDVSEDSLAGPTGAKPENIEPVEPLTLSRKNPCGNAFTANVASPLRARTNN